MARKVKRQRSSSSCEEKENFERTTEGKCTSSIQIIIRPQKKSTENKNNTLHKIRAAFSPKARTYCRDEEKRRIVEFIESEEGVLHILGHPGTGKTSVVLEVLTEYDHEYYNYCNDGKDIGARIRGSKSRVVVIDEFDRFYKEEKLESRNIMKLLRQNNVKAITISNTGHFSGIIFQSYSTDDIQKIIKEKIANEIGIEIASDAAIQALSRKHGRKGDIRGAINELMLLLLTKKNLYVELKDVLSFQKDNDSLPENSIHRDFIAESYKKSSSFTAVYRDYIKKCITHSISYLSRPEAKRIYDSL